MKKTKVLRWARSGSYRTHRCSSFNNVENRIAKCNYSSNEKVPKTMKAVQINQTGGTNVLEYNTIPTPSLTSPDNLVIKNDVVGVNYIDIYHRKGTYEKPFPHTLGVEAVGTIVKLDEGYVAAKPKFMGVSVGRSPHQIFKDRPLEVGDRVAYIHAGTYAQYTEVPRSKVVKIPPKITNDEACASLIQGFTAHYLCYSSHTITPGENVLVHAAAGGTGLLICQLALFLGANVIGTVSTAEKQEYVTNFITKNVREKVSTFNIIPYENWPEAVETLTNGEKCHVVYDGVGAKTFQNSLKSLRRRGSMVLFGASSGPVEPFDPIDLMKYGSLTLTRPTLFDFIATKEELQETADDVFSFVKAGDLTVNVGGRYLLSKAADAQKDLESRDTMGKLLLYPGEVLPEPEPPRPKTRPVSRMRPPTQPDLYD